jgi:hypothetical protein
MPSSLESLREIKLAVENLIPGLLENDKKEFQQYLEEYDFLLNRFYHENLELMLPEQYRACKEDVEYFLRILTLAMAYYDDIQR